MWPRSSSPPRQQQCPECKDSLLRRCAQLWPMWVTKLHSRFMHSWRTPAHGLRAPTQPADVRFVCRRDWGIQYSRFTEVLPTRSFLAPLEEDEEIEVRRNNPP